MFTCNSCSRRAIRSFAVFDFQAAKSDGLLPSIAKNPSTHASAAFTRKHATIASIRKGHHLKLLRKAFQSNEETPMNRRERLRGPPAVSRRNARARDANKHHLDIRTEDDTTRLLAKYTSDVGLQTALKWTGGDALKLAKSVLDKLKIGDPQKALEMVRLSEKLPGADGEKGVDSVVSWNHIMDFYMCKGSTREAFRVFNEMKKRGHQPDAHTYTIMLRGFTMNHQKPGAVEEAMKVYDSMWRPESKVKPNIIHSNAVINCLGRALNMDALWSVAGRLPDRGPGAADKWTYTTILNTMQACAIRDAGQLAETDGNMEAAAKVIQTAISEGRRLWEDIVSRWRSGDVNIDQTLVCAMGRLLLLGQKRDWDDVYSLVEQTMRLPRLKPPLVDRGKDNDEKLEDEVDLPAPKEDDGSTGLEQLQLDVADEAAPKARNEFAVVDLSDRQMRGRDETYVSSPYASVGNNVLSMLIEAAIKLRDLAVGKMYWDKLTNPDREPFVMPDDNNLHTYLRLLRISRSSKMVCDLLRDPVNVAVEGIWYRRGTFMIAMSTCVRDFKNPNVFTYASKILDLMEVKLHHPDLKVMTMYLSLAVVTTPGVSAEINGDFNAQQGQNNLIRAIKRFTYSDLDYRLILNKWVASSGIEEQDELYVGRRHSKPSIHPPKELLEFMQTLDSAYDKLLNHRLKMTEQMASAFTIQKRDLSKTIQKLNSTALPPSRSEFGEEEPADLFRDQDDDIRSGRYPGETNRSNRQPIKGPRVVDLEKRHPFLHDRVESRGEEQGSQRYREPTQNSDSSSTSEGWGKAWKDSLTAIGKDGKRKDWVVM